MDCYTERAYLLALLATMFPALGYIDEEGDPGFQRVVALFVGGYWHCWHISDKDLELFHHVPMKREEDTIYDGHTTELKYARIRGFVAMPSLWE